MSKLETPNIHIGLDNIATSSTTCDLGVIIDSALSMSPHMAAVCKAATFQLHCISLVHWFFTKDPTKTLFYWLISSCLGYCISALAGLPDSETNKLLCIQNAMANVTKQYQKFYSITPILDSCHWLPVKQCIAFKIWVLTFKSLHDLASQYLKSLTVSYVPKRNLCSSTNLTLTDPKSCT